MCARTSHLPRHANRVQKCRVRRIRACGDDFVQNARRHAFVELRHDQAAYRLKIIKVMPVLVIHLWAERDQFFLSADSEPDQTSSFLDRTILKLWQAVATSAAAADTSTLSALDTVAAIVLVVADDCWHVVAAHEHVLMLSLVPHLDRHIGSIVSDVQSPDLH